MRCRSVMSASTSAQNLRATVTGGGRLRLPSSSCARRPSLSKSDASRGDSEAARATARLGSSRSRFLLSQLSPEIAPSASAWRTYGYRLYYIRLQALLQTVTGSIANGYMLYYRRLQALLQTVTGSITYGYRLCYIRLQALLLTVAGSNAYGYRHGLSVGV